jgi:hypothetical protein
MHNDRSSLKLASLSGVPHGLQGGCPVAGLAIAQR